MGEEKDNTLVLAHLGLFGESQCADPQKAEVNLGYAKDSVHYRYLVVKSEVPGQKVGTIMESKDVTFFEDIFSMRDMQRTSRQESEETHEPAIPMEYY